MALQAFVSSEHGLDADEAIARLTAFGQALVKRFLGASRRIEDET